LEVPTPALPSADEVVVKPVLARNAIQAECALGALSQSTLAGGREFGLCSGYLPHQAIVVCRVAHGVSPFSVWR
jgi:hypothetical protein